MARTHIRLLRTMGACPEAVVFAEKYPSLKAAWTACKRGDWMLWFIGRRVTGVWGSTEHRKIVGVACRCARLAEKQWKDKRSIDAVVLAERYAAGEQIAQADLRAAAAAAAAAAWDAADAAAAAAARAEVLAACAEIVREAYPVPPKGAAK